MIRFLYADRLHRYPTLAEGMFRDRTRQFRDRLAWEVPIDETGVERDLYDRANPLYLIAECAAGGHLGSLRFLPTTGPAMVNDHFRHLIGGGTLVSPLIWEATRFCIAPGAPRETSAALMAAAAFMGRRAGIGHAVGVFAPAMIRVYRSIGWPVEILGQDADTCVGLWHFADAPVTRLCRRAGLDAEALEAAARRDLAGAAPVPA
jgi:N-acyl-L-homoserine lactone synthetase